MEYWINSLIAFMSSLWGIGAALLLIVLMVSVVKWARGMPKGAYLFIMLMTVCAIFPIPPPVYKNVAKAKQEQIKRREDAGDDDDDIDD